MWSAQGVQVETPQSYRGRVQEFLSWLASNDDASSRDRATEFFRLLGLDQQAYTALHVQHVTGLALRELLAQRSGVNTTSANELRSVAMGTYAALTDLDFRQLNAIFATANDIELVDSFQLRRSRAEFSKPARTEGLNGVFQRGLDAIDREARPEGAHAVFAVSGHFTVPDSYVLSNGTCLTAAFGMQLAKVAGKDVSPITEGQLVAYRDATAMPVAVNSDLQLSNGLDSPSRNLANLVSDLGAAGLVLSEAQHQAVDMRLEVEAVKRDLNQLIAQADAVVSALQAQGSQPETVAAKELKDEIAEFGGMDEFIKIQQELLNQFTMQKGERNGREAAATFYHAKQNVLAQHSQVATPSVSA